MKKRESSYWKQRFDQIEQAANNQSAEYLHELEEKYRAAVYEIDKKINAWYQRIAFNNDLVTISDAKKLLNKGELEEFKWNVKQYIKAGRENGINKKWEKELENASARFHINRLEALKLEIRQQVELATGGLVDDVDDLLKRVYTDTFYKSCFEVQKGFGVGFDVSQLDDNLVSKLISKPWSVDGVNFSEKLWKNKALLINNLDQELSRMVLTGSSPRKAVKRIKKAMDSSLYAAKRLVYTEQAFFTSAAQKDMYDELDVEEYEFVGTLDHLMCGECAKLDGKHYPIEEMVVGVNAPPIHPFCRCTTCPYFNDEFTLGKRASRDEEGNTVYEVPANMTYQEWKENFVDGGSKDGLKPLDLQFFSYKGVVITSEKDVSHAAFGAKIITSEWISEGKGNTKSVEDVHDFVLDGVNYTVDGKHVVLDYKEHERHIADVLHSEYGRSVLMMPRVQKPQNIKTPDFLIEGKRFDLKTPTGAGKEVLFGMVKGKREQADNFIFDISNCPLSVNVLSEQAEKLFISRHTKFIDTVVLMKDEKIVLVLQRN